MSEELNNQNSAEPQVETPTNAPAMEFVTQINILKKSEHLKSPNNLRGKAVPYQVHGKGNRKKRK